MTWRAFMIGLIAVLMLCLLEPYTSFNKGYGYSAGDHFPAGAVFMLVLLVLVVNVVIKKIRRRAAFRQAELMLVWCMLIVGASVPSDGLANFWFTMMAGPSYLAKRTDIVWKDTALAAAPDDLLVTKRASSVAVERFYEGHAEGGRVPWGHWLRPMGRWLVFIAAFYGAVIFVCAVLRRQWVDVERLQFPLARVPLEFSEGSAGQGLLPSIFANRAFVIGFLGATGFRLLRAVPLLAGGTQPWAIPFPLHDVLQGTPLQYLWMANFNLWWMPIGFAYLVPADVSLSVWLFYLFGRFELLVCHWVGSPLSSGTWSPLMRWQQAGAYIAFAVGMLYMSRRQLVLVFRRAFGLGPDVDDSQEPIGYRLSFWGFVLCSLVAIGWFVHYDINVGVAVGLFVLLLCIQLIHARMVCQSGLYATWLIWNPADLLHGLSFGHAFTAVGAVVAQMQRRVMLHKVLLAPAAMHAFRIGDVFRKSRRLLLPILLATLAVAVAASSWMSLRQAYTDGVVNYESPWRQLGNAKQAFDAAHLQIKRPDLNQVEWTGVGLGAVLTGGVMFMRARFYWWPVHSIGILAMSNWSADRIWLPFLLGWLIKLSLLKLGSGRMVRQARFFFIGLILAEGSLSCVSTIVRTLTKGSFPGL